MERNIFIAKRDADQFAYPYLFHLPEFEMFSGLESVEQASRYAKAATGFLWLEWANGFNLRLLHEHGPFEAYTVVRIHDWEVRTGFVDGFPWEKVDAIWFINRETQKDFNDLVPGQEAKQFVLPNAVSWQQFEALVRAERWERGRKSKSGIAGEIEKDPYSLALLSISCRPRKRIDRALRLLSLLPEPFHLTIRVGLSDEFAHVYDDLRALEDVLGLTGRVRWETEGFDVSRQKDKTDVVEFFADKAFVLSTSDHEGFHYAIAEGALCGCVPIVYNWEWGDPRQFWKPFVHDTLGRMEARIIAKTEQLEKGYPIGDACRHYVRTCFGADKLSRQLLQKLQAMRADR